MVEGTSRSADHGAVDRIDARVILAAAATGPLRFPIISLFARRSLDAHRWRLRPESPRRRQLRALLSLPLRAVLVLVGGMLLPLLRAMSLLVTTVCVIVYPYTLAVALAHGGLVVAWQSAGLDVMTACLLGSVASVVVTFYALAPMAELGAALKSDPDAWRARCLRATREVLDHLARRLDGRTPLRVVMDIADVETWAENEGAYIKGSSSLREAEQTWLTIDGDDASLPIRLGTTVTHQGTTATIGEYLECRVPLHLARADLWRHDDALPFFAADPHRGRVVFAVDRTWTPVRDRRARHAFVGPTFGGTFPIEPILRRLDEVHDHLCAPGPPPMAPAPRTWADHVPTLAALTTTALGLAWLGLGIAFLLQAHHLVDAQRGVAGMPSSILAACGALFVVPALFSVALGRALHRRERRAWVMLVAGALVLLGLALLPPLHLPWWVPPGPLLLLALFMPKAVRWRFGLGPAALIADVEALKVVTVDALAQRHGVDRATVLHQLEYDARCGRFQGSYDLVAGEVRSADTTANDDERQRCPGCASVVRARGAVLRCGHCGTELAGRTRVDPPMPRPVSLEVVSGGLVLLGWCALAPALVSTTMLFAVGILDEGLARIALGFLSCTVLPVAYWHTCLRAGAHLQAGDRRALRLAMLVLPPTWLLLRRPLVQRLFGIGLTPLQEALATTGEQSFTEAARSLSISTLELEQLAPFLVGKHWIDAVVDWQGRRLLRRDHLALDGRRRCSGCGSPLRFGGQCGWCGCIASTDAAEAS
jgi:ribosomal protein L37AE/L43A